MDSNSVDSPDVMGYNELNDEMTHVVKMDEQSPIHNVECKHTTLIPDETDTIGDAVYHGCQDCPVGFYIQPQKT